MNCIKCGNKLGENDKFCTECGTAIDDNPTQVLTPIVSVEPLEGGEAKPISSMVEKEEPVAKPATTPAPEVITETKVIEKEIIKEVPVQTPVQESQVQPAVQPTSNMQQAPVEAAPAVTKVITESAPKKNKSGIAFVILALVLIATIGALVYVISQKNNDKKQEVTPETTVTTTEEVTTEPVAVEETIETVDYYEYKIAIPEGMKGELNTTTNSVEIYDGTNFDMNVYLYSSDSYALATTENIQAINPEAVYNYENITVGSYNAIRVTYANSEKTCVEYVININDTMTMYVNAVMQGTVTTDSSYAYVTEVATSSVLTVTDETVTPTVLPVLTTDVFKFSDSIRLSE